MNPELAHLCAICLTDLSGGDNAPTLSSSPACPCQFHTSCLIRHTATTVYWNDVVCPSCDATLFARHVLTETGGSSEPTPAPELSPAALEDLKALKQLQRVATKAKGAAQAFIRQRNAEFKTQTTPFKQQIRVLRLQHKAAYRASEEKRAFCSASIKYTRAYYTFIRKHGLHGGDMRKLGLRGIRWLRRGSLTPVMRV